jgi:hypothetical protein
MQNFFSFSGILQCRLEKKIKKYSTKIKSSPSHLIILQDTASQCPVIRLLYPCVSRKAAWHTATTNILPASPSLSRPLIFRQRPLQELSHVFFTLSRLYWHFHDLYEHCWRSHSLKWHFHGHILHSHALPLVTFSGPLLAISQYSIHDHSLVIRL